MKLDDIEMLVAHRKVFKECETMLTACILGIGLSIKYGELYVKDVATLKAVKQVLLVGAEKNYKDAKTKLMMLGVTEFPDVPTAK